MKRPFQKPTIEQTVEKTEQQASKECNCDQAKIAKSLYRASEKAKEEGNETLASALLERAIILALPYILQDAGDEQ